MESAGEFKILINLLTAHEDMEVKVVDGTGVASDFLVFDFGNEHETTLKGGYVHNFIQDEIFDAGLLNDEPNGAKVLNAYFEADGAILDYDRGGMIQAVLDNDGGAII